MPVAQPTRVCAAASTTPAGATPTARQPEPPVAANPNPAENAIPPFIASVLLTLRNKQNSISVETADGKVEYRNALVLAPMVRCGTLPMRVLALHHGADVVYSPEIIAQRLIASRRVENTLLGTVDFLDKLGRVDLRILPLEKSRLVVQLGAADPALAVEAARKVANDVAGIDLNCGCPKHFSIQGGMGAALLTNPDRICSILRALADAFPHLSISCKIRILPSMDETLALVSKICQSGIRALAVHTRTKDERPKDKPHWDALAPIAKLVTEKYPNVALIGNGDVFNYKAFEDIRKASNGLVGSAMLARAAQWNPTIFRCLRNPDAFPKPVPAPEAARQYIQIAIFWDMPYQNTKFCLQSIMAGMDQTVVKASQTAKSMSDIARAHGLYEVYEQILGLRAKFAAANTGMAAFLDSNDRVNYDHEFPYIPDAPYIPGVTITVDESKYDSIVPGCNTEELAVTVDEDIEDKNFTFTVTGVKRKYDETKV